MEKASRIEVVTNRTVGVCCPGIWSWRWKLGPHLGLPTNLSWCWWLSLFPFDFIFYFVFTLGSSGSPAGSEDQSLLSELQAVCPGEENHPGWLGKWEASSKAPVHHPRDGSCLFLPANTELPGVQKPPVLPGHRWSSLCIPVGTRLPPRLPAPGLPAQPHPPHPLRCPDCHCHQAGPGGCGGST